MLLSTRSFLNTLRLSDAQLSLIGPLHSVLAEYLRARPGDDADLAAAAEGPRMLMTAEACRDPSAWALLNACLPHIRAVDLAPTHNRNGTK